MRCLQCNYPLWNLKARQCPECGEPFTPSEREFVVNSVRFCCSHCDQAYYGTGERGHLEPDGFDCVNCGQSIIMDEMVLRPAEGVSEEQTRVDRVPWMDRKEIGFFKAWFGTVGLSMTAPVRLGRDGGSQARSADAWSFAFVCWALQSIVGVGLPFAVVGLIQYATGDPGGLAVAGTGLIVALTLFVASVLGLLIWGLVAHGMLRITGGSAESIGTTFRALCWATGPTAIMVVPCMGPYCGSYVGGPWQVVSGCLTVMAAQQVHGGRATLAVLTAPVLAVTLGIGSYAVLMYAMFAGINTAMTMGTSDISGETQVIADAVSAHGADNNGAGPAHGLQLLQGDAGPWDFTLSHTDTMLEDVPVGDSTLEQIQYEPPNTQNQTVQTLVDGQPDGLIAHRVGDFIFTHHGVDLIAGDDDLWIVIAWPDPDVATFSGGFTEVAVATAEGGVTVMTADDLRASLPAQNTLRAGSGLPPLPDPDEVRHGAPAVAP